MRTRVGAGAYMQAGMIPCLAIVTHSLLHSCLKYPPNQGSTAGGSITAHNGPTIDFIPFMQEFISRASIVRYTASQAFLEAYRFYSLHAIRRFPSISQFRYPLKATENASTQSSDAIVLSYAVACQNGTAWLSAFNSSF